MDDIIVLGRMPEEDRRRKLEELGEIEPGSAGGVEKSVEKSWWSSVPKAYEHTAHAFGYVPPSPPQDDLSEVRSAIAMPADTGLQGRRIKVTLDQLRVYKYPGGGKHLVLVQFQAAHQRKDGTDELHFGATFSVRKGESAAVVNYPVFLGLNVGTEGASFRCLTINVKNEEDEKFLSFLESDVLSQGLTLVETFQPAVKPLSSIALGLAKSVAKRNRNIAVQEFFLGLDFGRNATAAKLREGTYFAVQVPEEVRATCWDEWAFNPRSGSLVTREDGQPILYNYLAFGISSQD